MTIILKTPENELDLTARWHPPEDGQRGVVELHDGDDVYADEWADCPLIAQAWVDDYDFEELEREVAGFAEPDYDYDPYEGRYSRC